MWEGPWTILGNIQAHLNWESVPLPVIGTHPDTYFEDDGLEVYRQADTASYPPTMKAIKWLSDHSFPWTTQVRGQSAGVDPRHARLHDAGPKYRQAFITSMPNATVASVPTLSTADFEYYSLAPSP